MSKYEGLFKFEAQAKWPSATPKLALVASQAALMHSVIKEVRHTS